MKHISTLKKDITLVIYNSLKYSTTKQFPLRLPIRCFDDAILCKYLKIKGAIEQD